MAIVKRLALLSLNNINKTQAPSVAAMATGSIDPTIPKRPAHGYNLFTAERFPGEHKNNPNAKMTDTVRSVAAQWNKLGDGGKKPYNERAAKLKALYDAQITDVQRALLTVERKKKQQAKEQMKAKVNRHQLAVEHGRPKKLPTTYALFYKEKYATLPAAERKAVVVAAKKIAAAWRDLPDSQKSSFEARAAKNSAKNREALDTWKQAMVRSGHQDDLVAIMGKK